MTRRTLATAFVALLFATGAGAQISQGEYGSRRAALGARMGDGVLLALGAREPREDYLSFFQTSQFEYLTGYDEPNAALVIVKRNGQAAATLFVEPRDPGREVWMGSRNGLDGASARTKMQTRLVADLPTVLDSLTTNGGKLYVVGDASEDGEAPSAIDARVVQQLKAKRASLEVVDASPLVLTLRGTKTAGELDLIRRAVDITVDAQRAAARVVEPGINEFEAQAVIEYTFRRDGADRPSFSSIVGSGPNSTTLHYSKDDRFMNAGEVVVMDIGAAYRGYAADVTRTYPVGATFSAAQREIYQLVRDAQASAERQAKVGAQARLMSDSASAVLAAGLAKLGLIESPSATFDCPGGDGKVRQCPQLMLFYMHGLGHGIGLDVHDPDQFYFTGVLAAGSAFTIEPGIYVRANLADVLPKTARNAQLAARIGAVAARYANVGVRIEDDYVVTDSGVEWISRAPRELAEIEALVKEPRAGPGPRDAKKIDWYRKTETPR